MTKHDPGAYSVVVFDRLGSAVVMRCIYNTEIRRELWASQPSR